MADEGFRIMELHLQGFGCSQILMQLALDARGETNPDLLRATNGLLFGLGCGKICGALTGGCCVLGLYTGKGTSSEQVDDSLYPMDNRLVEWFEAEYSRQYGGIDCADITHNDPKLRLERCPQIMERTFDKVTELLAENNFSLSERRGAAGTKV
jgi:C_GCAxxG_C_C family probable redox protein